MKVDSKLRECAIEIVDMFERDAKFYENDEQLKEALHFSSEAFGRNFRDKIREEAEERGLM